MLKDKAHCPFPALWVIAFVSVHCPILSRNGVSGNFGVVHSTSTMALYAGSVRTLGWNTHRYRAVLRGLDLRALLVV